MIVKHPIPTSTIKFKSLTIKHSERKTKKMKKTSEIKAMVEPEVKKKFKEKAEALNLSVTGLIEKIALEPLVFMDSNVKNLFNNMGKVFTNSN